MTKLDHLKHFATSAFLSAAPVLLVALTDSKWAHAAWALPAAGVIRWAYRALGGTGTLAVVAWIGLALSLGLSGCATTGTPSPGVTAFGHCTTDALKKASQGILGDVMTALATGDYVAELAKLATQFGGDEVGCAVDLAIAQLAGQRAASPDPVVATMLAHAQAWRGANP